MKTRNSHGLLQLGREALAYCQCASALISGNKALFVSVDLIGEKNQVILELRINTSLRINPQGLHNRVYLDPHLRLVELSFQCGGLSDVTNGIAIAWM